MLVLYVFLQYLYTRIQCKLDVPCCRYNRVLSYCRSKLANVMFARELARRMLCSNVTVCSIHPGVVKTELGRYLMSGWLVLLKVSSVGLAVP